MCVQAVHGGSFPRIARNFLSEDAHRIRGVGSRLFVRTATLIYDDGEKEEVAPIADHAEVYILRHDSMEEDH